MFGGLEAANVRAHDAFDVAKTAYTGKFGGEVARCHIGPKIGPPHVARAGLRADGAPYAGQGLVELGPDGRLKAIESLAELQLGFCVQTLTGAVQAVGGQ